MIGEKIRKIRIIRGYSQQYVADQLDISQAAYSDIETGKTKINLEKLRKIASLFDLDVNSVVDFHEDKMLKKKNYKMDKNKDEISILRELFDKERELYKEQINNLKSEIAYLRNKLDNIYFR